MRRARGELVSSAISGLAACVSTAKFAVRTTGILSNLIQQLGFWTRLNLNGLGKVQVNFNRLGIFVVENVALNMH